MPSQQLLAAPQCAAVTALTNSLKPLTDLGALQLGGVSVRGAELLLSRGVACGRPCGCKGRRCPEASRYCTLIGGRTLCGLGCSYPSARMLHSSGAGPGRGHPAAPTHLPRPNPLSTCSACSPCWPPRTRSCPWLAL